VFLSSVAALPRNRAQCWGSLNKAIAAMKALIAEIGSDEAHGDSN